jgi:hypothetical protein
MADKSVTITYTDDGSNGGNGSFSASMDPIVMNGSGKITFDLAMGPNTTGWAWSTDANYPAFELKAIPESDPFTFSIQPNGTLKVDDNNGVTSGEVDFEYSLNVQKGPLVHTWDPKIINEPPPTISYRVAQPA